MYCFTAAIFNICFLTITSAINLNFQGSFDNKKLTYYYKVELPVDTERLMLDTQKRELRMREDKEAQKRTIKVSANIDSFEINRDIDSETAEATERSTKRHKFKQRNEKMNNNRQNGGYTSKEKVVSDVPAFKSEEHGSVEIQNQFDPEKYLRQLPLSKLNYSSAENNSKDDTDIKNEKQTEENEIPNNKIQSTIKKKAAVALLKNSHEVKDDVHIQAYLSHILNSGLNIFSVLKANSTDYDFERHLDQLSKAYDKKYREFMKDTLNDHIKTELGQQKAILNAIDVSDRILKRLLNYFVADLDQNGQLTENLNMANQFQEAVREGTKQEFNHVCEKYHICRSENGFSEFLTEFITIILRLNNTKFSETIFSLVYVLKETDLENILPKDTLKDINSTLDRMEKQELSRLRTAFMVIKNLIANKNRPITVYRANFNTTRIKSTLAFLEIIEALEEALPRIDANIIEWGDLVTNLGEWEKDKRSDVSDIMAGFIEHIITGFERMSPSVRNRVAEKMDKVEILWKI